MERIGITHGLRGWFAVLYDDDGPIQSGIGSYRTPEEAKREAIDWARTERLWTDFDRSEYERNI